MPARKYLIPKIKQNLTNSILAVMDEQLKIEKFVMEFDRLISIRHSSNHDGNQMTANEEHFLAAVTKSKSDIDNFLLSARTFNSAVVGSLEYDDRVNEFLQALPSIVSSVLEIDALLQSISKEAAVSEAAAPVADASPAVETVLTVEALSEATDQAEIATPNQAEIATLNQAQETEFFEVLIDDAPATSSQLLENELKLLEQMKRKGEKLEKFIKLARQANQSISTLHEDRIEIYEHAKQVHQYLVDPTPEAARLLTKQANQAKGSPSVVLQILGCLMAAIAVVAACFQAYPIVGVAAGLSAFSLYAGRRKGISAEMMAVKTEQLNKKPVDYDALPATVDSLETEESFLRKPAI